MAAPEQVTLQRIVGVADVDLRAFLEAEIRSARLTPGEGRELLMETLPGWAEPYENASAAVAADLYEQKRFAYGVDAVVPYRPSLAPRVDAARWGVLASWALAPVVDEADWGAAFQRIVGGAHRTIADAHRNTTMRNSISDPAARGWQRVGRGDDTCDFCHMLITRGDVYTRMSVDFRSHDNCMCSAESVFHSIKSDQMREYEKSLRHSTGRHDEKKVYERARARELLELEAEGLL